MCWRPIRGHAFHKSDKQWADLSSLPAVAVIGAGAALAIVITTLKPQTYFPDTTFLCKEFEFHARQSGIITCAWMAAGLGVLGTTATLGLPLLSSPTWTSVLFSTCTNQRSVLGNVDQSEVSIE